MPILKIVGLLLSLSISSFSFSEKISSYAELPEKVKEVVNIYAETHDDQSVEVFFDLSHGYKIYKENLKFEAQSTLNKIIKIELPESLSFLDPIKKTLVQGYSNQFSIIAFFEKESAQKILVEFQACSKNNCLTPQKASIDVTNTKENIASTKTEESSFFGRLIKSIKNSLDLQKNSLAFNLFIIFLAGILTSFTPCVFPLYPLSIGLFSEWTQKDPGKSFQLSLLYCLGMILCYASIGMVSILSGSVFASLTQRPIFYFALAFVLLISALVFLGVLNLNFIGKIQSYFSGSQSKNKSNYKIQAFAMGATLGFVAAPCVGPVLLTVIVWIQSFFIESVSALALIKGFSLLALFGIGMSLPFLVLAHFMIRLGKYLNPKKFILISKYLGTIAMFLSALYFANMGRKLLSGSQSSSSSIHSSDLWTGEFSQEWTFVDFRADWCAACIELEEKTFADNSVKDFIKKEKWNYKMVDMTTVEGIAEKLSNKYNVVSLPTVLIFSPEGKLCKNSTLNDFEEASSFIERLQKAKENCE